MIIAVDFDGILAGNGSEFPKIGLTNYAMVKLIQDLIENKHEVILWTTRNGEELQAALDWCKAYKLNFCSINSPAPSNAAAYEGAYPTQSRKVYADIYLDDHNPTYMVNYRKFGQVYAIHSMIQQVKEILSWEEEN